MIPWAAAWAAGPDARLAEARRAERDQRWSDAVVACEAAVAEAPGSPEGGACARQLDGWRLRRDPDGSFRSLAALEAARRGRAPADALAPWATDPSVPLVLRAEAAGLRARAALEAGDPAAARDLLAPWLTADVGDARVSAVLRALDAEAAAHQGAGGAAGTRAGQAAVRRGVRAADRAAALAGGATLVGLLPLAARGVDRALRPWGVGLLLAAGGAGWLVAEGWEAGAGRPVAWMTAGLTAVHLVSLPAQRAAPDARTRAAVRVAAAVASAAVAWLAVSRTGGLLALGLPV